MAHDNNVNIGDAGRGNTFNLRQYQQGISADRYIEYGVDLATRRRISQIDVQKNVLAYFLSYVPLMLSALADMFGVLDYLDLPFIPFALCGLLVVGVVWLRTRFYRDLASLNFESDEAKPFGDRWVEKEGQGGYVLYKKKAKCIHPKCDGTVNIVRAPVRERENHDFVGECSRGGKQHTYTVDYNNIGFPRRFDWRQLPKDSS